jgi:high-affinity Fe2+/Pb2+ permease
MLMVLCVIIYHSFYGICMVLYVIIYHSFYGISIASDSFNDIWSYVAAIVLVQHRLLGITMQLHTLLGMKAGDMA